MRVGYGRCRKNDGNNHRPSKAELWNERKRDRYEQVREFHRQGAGIQAIAREFRMQRRAVRATLRSETCSQRAIPSKRKSQIDRHVDYLAQRWAEGCHNSAQLHREIRAQGYRGAESSVRHSQGYAFRWVMTALRSHLGMKKTFEKWLDDLAGRVKKVAPRPDEEPLDKDDFASETEWQAFLNRHRGEALPPQILDPSFQYDSAQRAALIDKFLRKLDWKANPFLRSPRAMLDAGFTGVPYQL